MCRFLILYLSLLGWHSLLIGQDQFLALYSTWDDDLSEWELEYRTPGDEVEVAFLALKWPSRTDWEEWAFTLGEDTGSIRTKWRGQFDRWELRGFQTLLDIRTRWRNDVSEWVVSQGDKQIIVETRYTGDANLWIAKSGGRSFKMMTQYINDPRDWIIEDDLEDVSDDMKLAMIFIALFQSIPK